MQILQKLLTLIRRICLIEILQRQNFLTIFTDANPAGNVTSRQEYVRFLVMLISVGCAVSIKRVWLGYYFGRRICGTYVKQLPNMHFFFLLLTQV